MCDEHSKTGDPAVGSTRLVRCVCGNCIHFDPKPRLSAAESNVNMGEWAICRRWSLLCFPESCRCGGNGFSPNKQAHSRRPAND